MKKQHSTKFYGAFNHFSGTYEITKLYGYSQGKAPSNKSLAPRKSTNMSIWAVGTLNQLFIRGS